MRLFAKFRVSLFTLFLGNISFLLLEYEAGFIYSVSVNGFFLLVMTYGLIVFFIVSVLQFGYVLMKVSDVIESDRLNDLSVLLFLSVGFIIVFPLVPFFGYFLTVWAFISMYLVIGGIIYWVGREFYETKLKVLGLLVGVLSFFVVNSVALIVIMTVILGVFIVSEGFESYLSVDKSQVSRIVNKVLDVCKDRGFVDINEYGKRFSVPETLLVKAVKRLAIEKNCKVNKVMDKIVCEC